MPLPAIVTPLILAAGTQWITGSFQKRAAQIAAEKAQRDADLAQAAKIYDEVSTVIDTLHYYMTEEALFIAIRKALDKSISTDAVGWGKYMDALAEFKTSQNRQLAEVEVYFGKNAAEVLEIIGGHFHTGEHILEATYYNTENSMANLSSVQKSKDPYKAMKDYFFKTRDIGDLKDEIRKVNTIMMQKRQSGQIGDVPIS